MNEKYNKDNSAAEGFESGWYHVSGDKNYSRISYPLSNSSRGVFISTWFAVEMIRQETFHCVCQPGIV